MVDRKSNKLPWSFYAVIFTFGVFFLCLNMYILTIWLQHPLRSDLWLVASGAGLVGLIYSLWKTRVHQSERIQEKRKLTSDESI
ncbi:MAG: hypothetical protein EAX95_13115 [Candidatus Thorarchaeota archaeon]|nr:hypothetical protein [Candidatus Thorarchaeota archaeon]